MIKKVILVLIAISILLVSCSSPDPALTSSYTTDSAKPDMVSNTVANIDSASEVQSTNRVLLPTLQDKNLSKIGIYEKYNAVLSGENLVIGKDQATFTPEITMYRFGNGSSLVIGEPLINNATLSQKNSVATVNGSVIQWASKDVAFKFYSMADPLDSKSNAFEYLITIANSKAGTDTLLDKITFPIVSSGLTFCYQPPLTAQEVANGDNRPIDVVGSYAFYFGKSGDYSGVGGINYGTGKAFHIYRPKLIDNVGDIAYADLNISGGNMTISFTNISAWLNKAKYPVTIDPTFGYGGGGASSSTSTSSLAGVNISDIYAATSGDLITKFSVKASRSSGTGTVRVAVYSANSSSLPVSRLAASVSITVNTTAMYFDSGVIAQTLADNITYIVATDSNVDANISRYYDTISDNDTRVDSATALAATWTDNGVPLLRRYSAYATYNSGNRYWVGGTNDWNSTAGSKWAYTSNGTGGATAPTSVNNVYLDASSGNSSVTVTITSAVACNTLNMTGFSGKLAGSSAPTMYRDLIVGASVNLTNTGGATFTSAVIHSITSNGVIFSWNVNLGFAGAYIKLVDDLNIGTTKGISITSGGFIANGKTVTFSGTANTLTGNFTGTDSFYNLVRQPSNPAKTDSFTIGGNVSVNGTLTITNGATVTNRIWILSSVKGTQRTITSANNSIGNADFQDIIGAGVGSWDLSGIGIVGGSGDCQGNSGITFTANQTWHWYSNGGLWSNSQKWFTATNGTGTRLDADMRQAYVVLPQDDVIFDANSLSVNVAYTGFTTDMPRMGRTLDFSGLDQTLGMSGSTHYVFGNIIWSSGMTLWTGGQYVYLEGRGTNRTIKMDGGNISKAVYIVTPSGNYTLQDDFRTSDFLFLILGTFNANNHNVTCIYFNSYIAGTRTLLMGSGLWTITGTNIFLWRIESTAGLTTDSGTSTIKFTGALTGDCLFYGASQQYYNLWINTTNSQNITFTGSNIFNDIRAEPGAVIRFTAGTTTTTTTANLNGTLASPIIIKSNTTGVHNLAKAGGGTISGSYLNISSSNATPLSTWYAGTTSVNSGNNTGWIFSDLSTFIPQITIW